MEKIELNAGESIKIMVNGRVLELMVTGDTSISVNDNTEPKRLLTIKEIVDAEADKSGSYISSDDITDYLLSGYGKHYRDTHTEAQAHKLIAFAEIMRIADYYNEHYANGCKSDDYIIPNQKKYIIILNGDGKICVSWYKYYMCGLPCFATEELAQLALDNNREVFEKFFAV